MSRSGYGDDCEYLNLYRGAVERSINGQRGQEFLRELAESMDAMQDKILISGSLIDEQGHVCAIGVICKARGVDVSRVDYYDPRSVGKAVGIAQSMAAEIEYMNDEWWPLSGESPQQRWLRMREWVGENLRLAPNE